jgi:hypothetical protein
MKNSSRIQSNLQPSNATNYTPGSTTRKPPPEPKLGSRTSKRRKRIRWEFLFLFVFIVCVILVVSFVIIPLKRGVPLDALLSIYRLRFFGPEVIPVNFYAAYPEDFSYPQYNVQLNPYRSLALGEGKEIQGELQGAGEEVPISAQKKDSILEISLPSKKTTVGSSAGLAILDLSPGLHQFSSLILHSPSGALMSLNLGNLYWEILPKSSCIFVEESHFLVSMRFLRPGFNPLYKFYFQNTSQEAIRIKGVHIPPDLPYTIDPSSFKVEEKILTSLDVNKIREEPYPRVVVPDKNTNFPQEVVVLPQKGVLITFSLAPTSREAGKAIANLYPILETDDGKYLMEMFPSPKDGLVSFSISEIVHMLWGP